MADFTTEKEIEIFEIVAIFLSRKNIFLLISIFFFIFGIILSFTIEQKYKYITTIDIGFLVNNDGPDFDRHLADNPRAMRVEVIKVIIPEIFKNYSFVNDDNNLSVSVNYDKASIKLVTRARSGLLENVRRIHEDIASALIDSNDKSLKNIENEIIRNNKDNIEKVNRRDFFIKRSNINNVTVKLSDNFILYRIFTFIFTSIVGFVVSFFVVIILEFVSRYRYYAANRL